MLSIIVSSYQVKYFENFSKNITETIGDHFDYEIIQIWNPNEMGICEAYNKGALQAKYDNLLFVHEDIEFVTENWGEILLKYFKNYSTGVIGVAGGNYVPNCPFAWWDSYENDFRNMQQYSGDQLIRDYSLSKDTEVFVLDGVVLACRKSVWQQFRFNESIKGFHIYDLDFSIRVSNDFKNIVTSKIKIKHFSEGTKNKKWFENIIKYRKLYNKPDRQRVAKKKEAYFIQHFIDYLKEFSFSKKESFHLLFKYAKPKYIGWKLTAQIYSRILQGKL